MHNHGQPCAQLRENSVLNIQHSQNKEHFHHHCDWWSKSLSWDHANLSPLSPGETMTQWLVPKNCREMLFYMSHYNFMARDLGVDKILHQLMAHFYWPGLHSDVPQMCESYSKCQLVKASKGTPKVRLPSIKIFFERIGMDLVKRLGGMVESLWSRRCPGFQGTFPQSSDHMGISQWLCWA